MRRSHITAAGVIVCHSQRYKTKAVREQELSAALRAGNGVFIIGGTDDFAFTFRARNRIHRQLAIQDGFGDPILMNGFQTTTIIPPAMGLSTTLPEGALCLTRRFGDRLISNSEYIEGSLRFWQAA